MTRARLALVGMLVIGAPANAQEPRRTVGLGTLAGGGFAATSEASPFFGRTTTTIPILLHTLEGQIFLNKREWSIDLTLPLSNMIIVSGIVGGFFFQADAFFNFNLGTGNVRLVVGPGLGFTAALAKNTSGASFRMPFELGAELLVAKKHIGIKLLARPWVEFAGGSDHEVTRGIVVLLGLSGYRSTM